MIEIPLESVVSWATTGPVQHPNNVRIHCPRCGDIAVLAPQLQARLEHLSLSVSSATCPVCRSVIIFFGLGPHCTRDEKCESLAIHPSPEITRDVPSQFATLPRGVLDTYTEAVRSFNAKAWMAATAMCGRTIEEAVTQIAPSIQGRMLGEKLRDLPNQVDLAASLHRLADLVKDGRNLASHVNAKRPDYGMASEALDLTRYLLDYLFLLPKALDKLEQRVV